MPQPSFIMLAFTVFLPLFSSACSDAAEPQSRSVVETPAVIRSLEQQGFEVFGEYDAPGGLRDFAGLVGQRPVAVYVTPDGNYAVAGTLLNKRGEGIAAADVRRLVVAPLSERTWARLEQSHWVSDGDKNAPRVVYVFTDPNCPFCHRFWEVS